MIRQKGFSSSFICRKVLSDRSSLLMSTTREAIHEISDHSATEELIARLTLTAYDVALQQGNTGRFTDLQSALWREIGRVIHAFRFPAG